MKESSADVRNHWVGWRTTLSDLVALTAVSGLAVVGPLLDSLRNGATFFVAAGARGWAIVGFVVVWVFLPPLVGLIPVMFVGFFSQLWSRRVLAGEVGLLAAVWVVGLFEGSRGWSPVIWTVICLAMATGIAYLYRQFTNMRFVIGVLIIGPALLAVTFLGSKEVRPLLSPTAGTSSKVARNDTPVVQIVFDEFSLGMMLTPQGEVNERLFPNFARLAGTSTWYRNAKSSSGYTNLMVPAIDSGLWPQPGRVPIASNFPNNVFSLFGDDITWANESVTRLCSESSCERGGVPFVGLVRSSARVAWISSLPTSVSEPLVGSLADSWGSEGETEASAMKEFMARNADEADDLLPIAANVREFDQAVARLGPRGLVYDHLLLPHGPFVHLPNGKDYLVDGHPAWVGANWGVGKDPNGEPTVRQRVLLQAMYADRVLGDMLDSLEANPWFADAMVIVVADHGISVREGAQRRALGVPTQGAIDDVMAVPLFVKYPGQTNGTIDDRDARTIDVLPTIMDVTDADVEWSLDGRSLLLPPVEGRPLVWLPFGLAKSPPDATTTAVRNWSMLGDLAMAGEPFAIGPFADRIDTVLEAPTLEVVGKRCSLDPDRWSDVDVEDSTLPALVTARIDGVAVGTWALGVVNGRVAGMGLVYRGADSKVHVDIMLDPAALVAGSNELDLIAIGGDGEIRGRLPCG